MRIYSATLTGMIKKRALNRPARTYLHMENLRDMASMDPDLLRMSFMGIRIMRGRNRAIRARIPDSQMPMEREQPTPAIMSQVNMDHQGMDRRKAPMDPETTSARLDTARVEDLMNMAGASIESRQRTTTPMCPPTMETSMVLQNMRDPRNDPKDIIIVVLMKAEDERSFPMDPTWEEMTTCLDMARRNNQTNMIGTSMGERKGIKIRNRMTTILPDMTGPRHAAREMVGPKNDRMDQASEVMDIAKSELGPRSIPTKTPDVVEMLSTLADLPGMAGTRDDRRKDMATHQDMILAMVAMKLLALKGSTSAAESVAVITVTMMTASDTIMVTATESMTMMIRADNKLGVS